MPTLLTLDRDTTPVRLVDLEEDIRRGLVPLSAELCHPPWTGKESRRLDAIPELAEATGTAAACFAERLRSRPALWASTAISLLVVLAGTVQSLWQFGVLPGELLADLLLVGPTGLGPLLIDQQWWTPWSSQLVHGDVVHLILNLPVVFYCGYRVERALGPATTLLVASAAIALGSLLVAVFTSIPVIGSSIVAYGLWGAQIAIGLRMGEAVPRRQRGFYGWGSLVIFIPLYAMGLTSDGVSHWGHLGGLLGGALTALAVTSETMVGERRRRRARTNGVLALGIVAAMIAVSFAAPLAPAVVYAPYEDLDIERAGVTLSMPSRMAPNTWQVQGYDAWVPTTDNAEPVFCGLRKARYAAEDPTSDALGAYWGRLYGSDATETHVPPMEGWRALGFDLAPAVDVPPTRRVVEYRRRRGLWSVSMGYVLELDGRTEARERLYQHVVRSVRVGEVPSLAEERAKHARNPDNPKRQHDLALELWQAGHLEDAEGLFAQLEARRDAWAWTAARARLRMFEANPTWPGDPAWVQSWLERAPPEDEEIHRLGVSFLVRHDGCELARAHVEGLGDGVSEVLRSTLERAVEDCPVGE